MTIRKKTIGEASIDAGVTTKAIRLWEAKGLITNVERSGAHYRLFSDRDIAALKFIRQAKSLGLTLGEIRDIQELQDAGMSPCPRVVRAIDEHIDAIDRALADLAQLRCSLESARESSHSDGQTENATTSCPIIEDVEVCNGRPNHRTRRAV